MSNKVRGEFDLEDLALELIKKIGSNDAEKEEMTQMLDDARYIVLWEKLIDSAISLFAGDWKEAPNIYNIIFELLDTLNKDEEADTCAVLAYKIADMVSGKGDEGDIHHTETRLIVLANLYNAAFISDNFSTVRFNILRTIVDFAAAHKKVPGIETFLQGHEKVLASMKDISVSERRQTLLSIYKALNIHGSAASLAQIYLTQYLSSFNPESEHKHIDADVHKLACRAIGESIGNVLAVSFQAAQAPFFLRLNENYSLIVEIYNASIAPI